MIDARQAQELLTNITKGPWRHSETTLLEVWADRDAAGWDASWVATTENAYRNRPAVTAETVANARLIVAAPELAQTVIELHQRLQIAEAKVHLAEAIARSVRSDL